MTQHQLATVDFHGTPLTVITTPEGAHLVAMRPICEAIGLDWASQFTRIKRNPVMNEGVVVITTPSAGGNQQTTCLPLDLLNGWLFGVDVARCREEIRPRLIEYQRECYRALADYWLKGAAHNPRAETFTLEEHDQHNLRALLTLLDELRPLMRQVAAPLRAMASPLAGQLEEGGRNIALSKLALSRLRHQLALHSLRGKPLRKR